MTHQFVPRATNPAVLSHVCPKTCFAFSVSVCLTRPVRSIIFRSFTILRWPVIIRLDVKDIFQAFLGVHFWLLLRRNRLLVMAPVDAVPAPCAYRVDNAGTYHCVRHSDAECGSPMKYDWRGDLMDQLCPTCGR